MPSDAMRVWREARKAFGPFHDYEHPAGDRAAAAVIERAIADAVAEERAKTKALAEALRESIVTLAASRHLVAKYVPDHHWWSEHDKRIDDAKAALKAWGK